MDSTLLLFIITVVGSTIAAIVSVINIHFTKKKITSDTFTAFRHERFKEIKKEIGNFFDVYSEEASLDPANRIELIKILFKIELMFNYRGVNLYV